MSPRRSILPMLRQVFVLDQERFKTLADVPLLTSFFFIEQPEYDVPLLLSKGMDGERARQALDAVIAALSEQSEWTPEALLRTLDATVERLGFIRTKADGSPIPDRGPVFMLVRVGVSGRKETPGLTEMMTVLDASGSCGACKLRWRSYARWGR